MLQPIAAIILAIRLGLTDAREGRPAYGLAVITRAGYRREHVRHGWKDVGKVFVLAVIIDLIYDIVVHHRIYPGQSLIVAASLALLPYC
jgi:hypothetical protein